MLKLYAAVVLMLAALVSCGREKAAENGHMLSFIESYDLKFSEPSGLTLSGDRLSLWTVSDNGQVYNISLSGDVLKKIKIEKGDPEGITMINDTLLCIVLEKQRDLLYITTDGKITDEFKTGYEGYTNQGFEGITYDQQNGHTYILNEKNPGLLIKYDRIREKISETELDFAGDYSGIFYEQTQNSLWIVSHESRTISRCDLNGKVMEDVKVNINKIEGIAVDYPNKRVYVVSDADNMLFVYGIN